MCRDFKSNTPSLVADLSDAHKGRDGPWLHEAAHKLYGTITAFTTIGGAVASDLMLRLPECNNRERTRRRIANRHARPARPYVTDGSCDHSDLHVVELRGEAGDLFRQGRVGVLGPVVEPELRGGEARRRE